MPPAIHEAEMVLRDRLMSSLEESIRTISEEEHRLSRKKALLRQQLTALRVGTSPEVVLATLKAEGIRE